MIEHYTITIENAGMTRYLTYQLDCASNVVVEKFDGYVLSPYSGGGSYTRWLNLGPINHGHNVIEFSVVMPTADDGWFRNQLIISNTPAGD